jgi:hypothetical protein
MKPPVLPVGFAMATFSLEQEPLAKSGSPSAQAVIKRVDPSPAVFDDGRDPFRDRGPHQNDA